jgi:[acyl-carrier-protein] S-malonyltransferase
VTSLAALERLRVDNPHAVEQCAATAGFSVGEYAALVFAGVLSFEEGVCVQPGATRAGSIGRRDCARRAYATML